MSIDVKQALEEICKGNEQALRFCWAIYLFIQCQDDLFDRDKPVTAETLVKVNLNLISEAGTNLFYRQYQTTLFSVLTSASLAWVSSEEFKNREDVVDRFAGQILKSEYQNIFLQVALLVGGMDHALAVQSKYRSYFPDSISRTEKELVK